MLRSRMVRPPTLTTAYWLIEKREAGRTEVLTVGLSGDREALPVFSFEEEARLFIWLRRLGEGWDVRETVAGELLLLLFDPQTNAGWIALDPIPEIGGEVLTGIVSLSRQRFVDRHAGERELKSASLLRSRDGVSRKTTPG
jgi:hypothetical protein